MCTGSGLLQVPFLHKRLSQLEVASEQKATVSLTSDHFLVFSPHLFRWIGPYMGGVN